MKPVESNTNKFKVADGIILEKIEVTEGAKFTISVDGNDVGVLEQNPSGAWWATSNFTVHTGVHDVFIRSINRDVDQAVICFADKIRKEMA